MRVKHAILTRVGFSLVSCVRGRACLRIWHEPSVRAIHGHRMHVQFFFLNKYQISILILIFKFFLRELLIFKLLVLF